MQNRGRHLRFSRSIYWRRLLSLVVAAVVVVALTRYVSVDEGQPDICGLYQLESGEARVEVFRLDEELLARAVWSREYGPVEGDDVVVLRHLCYDSDEGRWSGEIYDPVHQKSYRATVCRQKDGSLRVTGHKGLLRLSMVWVRVVPE